MRTGCSERIDTRLKAFIVTAAHSTAAKVSSPSSDRAAVRASPRTCGSGRVVVASATSRTAHSTLSKSVESRHAGSCASFCSVAPASVVVPYQYTLILWGMLFGYLVFGEVLSPLTLAGAAIIVGACLYAARRRDIAQSAIEQAV